MRRPQAILVIIALLGAPLALLAHSVSADAATCGGMCCLPHHGHQHAASYPASMPNHQANHPSEACEHGGAAQMPNCGFDCGHPRQDYSFVSPLAPTKPSNLILIARSNSLRNAKFPAATQNAAAGFLASPFQPPRA
jgi:hypothetical protein